MNSCLIVIFLLFILLILAVYWEVNDYKRLEQRPNLDTLTDEEREKEYIFYSCFNYENNVKWRSIFIATTIATLLILAVLTLFNNFGVLRECYYDFLPALIILIFASIFVAFYGIEAYRSFHMYRPICSKIKQDITIL
jgi:hypothetical protein